MEWAPKGFDLKKEVPDSLKTKEIYGERVLESGRSQQGKAMKR